MQRVIGARDEGEVERSTGTSTIHVRVRYNTYFFKTGERVTCQPATTFPIFDRSYRLCNLVECQIAHILSKALSGVLRKYGILRCTIGDPANGTNVRTVRYEVMLQWYDSDTTIRPRVSATSRIAIDK